MLERLEQRLVLSTFRVNTTLDTVALNFKKGTDSTGHVSLRSADHWPLDSKGGSNTIIVPGGHVPVDHTRDQRGRKCER